MIAANMASPSVDTLVTTSAQVADRSPRAARETLQNVFSEVLQRAGESGYASATPVYAGEDINQAIHSSWADWFDQVGFSRYTAPASPANPSAQPGKTPEDVRADYEAILVEAYHRGGYATPQQYVQTLSPQQLATLQQVHHLADPIAPTSLSKEASLNLLLPPDAQVDRDGDGLTASGAGFLVQFPDSRTPRSVRDAWESATEHMSAGDKLTRQLQMKMPLLLANMKVDDAGSVTGVKQPGEADWVNPMLEPNFSYEDMAADWLSYLERFKSQIPPQQYQSDKQFWSDFRAQLAHYNGLTP